MVQKTKRNITKYLFWITVFLWLTYGTLIFIFIGGDREWAAGRYHTDLETLKEDRDDAFKQGSGVRRDQWGEITDFNLTTEEVVRRHDTQERRAGTYYREVMDQPPEDYSGFMRYITRNPIEVGGYLVVLGVILSLFFSFWDSLWAKRRK